MPRRGDPRTSLRHFARHDPRRRFELTDGAVAHISTSEEAAECVAAGVDGLEHMVLDDGEVLDQVLAAAQERGVFWTPTLSLFDRMAHESEPATYIDDYRPDGFVSRTVLLSVREWAARGRESPPDAPIPRWERTVELAGRTHTAGVRLALGTDAGMTAVFHGLAVHRELELLVRAGLLRPRRCARRRRSQPPRWARTRGSARSRWARRPIS